MIEPGPYRKIDPSEVVKKRPVPPPERIEPIVCKPGQEKPSGRIIQLEDLRIKHGITREEEDELRELYQQQEEELKK